LKVTTEPIVIEINEKIVIGSIHCLVENNSLAQQSGTNHKRKTNIFKGDSQSMALGTDL
jgi:hypothetical protein